MCGRMRQLWWFREAFADERLIFVGAGCPTVPAMPPGRRLCLGGACASPFASHIQHLLQVYRQPNGSRGLVAGCVPSGIPDACELPLGAWRLCNVDDECDAQSPD